jgi:hypothetical protein
VIVTSPAARVAIVTPQSGVMASHFQRVMQALCEDANGLFAGSASGASFVLDGIQSGRSLIRIAFDLVPASDGVNLWLLARTGSGTDVTAYSWAWPYNNAAATAAADADTSDTQIVAAALVQSDSNTGGVHGEVTISNIQSSRYKRAGGWCTHFDGSRERFTGVAGRIDTALPITGIKLMFSSGDIASGYVRVEAP